MVQEVGELIIRQTEKQVKTVITDLDKKKKKESQMVEISVSGNLIAYRVSRN